MNTDTKKVSEKRVTSSSSSKKESSSNVEKQSVSSGSKPTGSSSNSNANQNINKVRSNNCNSVKEKQVDKVEKVEDNLDEEEFNKELDRLLNKYHKLLRGLDYRNMLYYAALFQQLFKDFIIDSEEGGKIDKSIEYLAQLLNKACDKCNFDIYNASIPQIIKLYGVLIQKLGGENKLRDLDPQAIKNLETLLFRMYSDEEILDILEELENSEINPDNIVGITEDDKILFTNSKKYPLEPSSKYDDLIEYLEKLNTK